MVTRPFTKIQRVIQTDTPYKLAEIIRDTWPNLFYLKKVNNNDCIGITTTTEMAYPVLDNGMGKML